jgi:serine/threonine protein kinase
MVMMRPRTRVRMTCHADWKAVEVLGRGTYGCVEKVQHIVTREVLARKSHQSSDGGGGSTSGVDAMLVREISISQAVQHKHVLSLEALSINPTDRSISLLTQMHATSLKEHVRTLCSSTKQDGAFIELADLRKWMRQLLEGVAHLHQNCIIHRDLKPANLLLTYTHDLVVADLGMARFVPSVGDASCLLPMTPEVQSQWYRAPEVLLLLAAPASATNTTTAPYGEAIDMFSVGAIMGEWMARGQPIFQGRTSADTLLAICCVMGTPNATTWPGMTSEQQSFVAKLPQWPSSVDIFLKPAATRYGPAAVDLFKHLVCMNPRNRISARAALAHDFLK